MNKKQIQELIEKFKEQQKLNLELFEKEIKVMGNTMDYKEEIMELRLSIYTTKKNLKFLNSLGIKK